MTDDELIAREHENWIAYLTGVVSCTSGANVTRVGGVVTILIGLPFDWFNQVLVEHEEATPDGRRLHDILARFSACSRRHPARGSWT
jgi:hypothetical protein